ncbi:SDR family oxidoreductase [Dickeya chrysanthemi]|uniref:SDR family oxidoreductase n=1 Tax=Dickeya chrysanthemi TaxID=556 RepID=UPI0003A735B5|nr:SDR family oxidoreductase [Dickeya chrysanthemi]MBX9446562.1 SDR family oxidoreductase [Dickeya chrysanthemi]MCA7009416.1 SDR family oxidoreductase [Dickeya chrysanthemi]
MKRVFITGATGFLGGAIMEKALQDKQIEKIYMLVRATTRQDGLKRILNNLRKFDISESRLSCLTEENIIIGDLADPESFIHHPVLDGITHVINSAAIASFGNNPLIWKVNVEGTLAFAKRMSQVTSLRKFIQIGTAMSCVPDQDQVVEECGQLDTEKSHIVEYTLSKATIENLMREHCPAMPLLIVRPSIIVGHSHLGCKPSSSIYWVFEMAMKLQRFMCSLDDKIDVIPVDFCAEAIMMLLHTEQAVNDIYHISAGEASSVSFNEVDQAMAQAAARPPMGADYRQVSYHDLIKLRSRFSDLYGPCNERLMLRAMRLYGSFAQLNVKFSNRKLLQLGMKTPPRFTEYVGKCVETTRQFSVPELMTVDFK